MDILDIIKSRRSIRKFKPDAIPKELLIKVLEAARWAPSWANTQCWEFIIVNDVEIKKKLAETLVPERNPAKSAIIEAPIVIVVLAKKGVSGYYKGQPMTKFGDWFMFDVALAVQNLVLEAYSLGLGTVIVGSFNHDRVAEILNVPKDREVVVMIPMGYPAESPPPRPRKELHEMIYLNKFGIKYSF